MNLFCFILLFIDSSHCFSLLFLISITFKDVTLEDITPKSPMFYIVYIIFRYKRKDSVCFEIAFRGDNVFDHCVRLSIFKNLETPLILVYLPSHSNSMEGKKWLKENFRLGLINNPAFDIINVLDYLHFITIKMTSCRSQQCKV